MLATGNKDKVRELEALLAGTTVTAAPDGFDPDDTGIRSRVNGVIALDTRTSDMVFSVAEIVSFCSRVMTLLPGDVISTGTPSGVVAIRSMPAKRSKAAATVKRSRSAKGSQVCPRKAK